MFRKLHLNIKVLYDFNGLLSELKFVDNGIKQSDIPALKLFAVYFAVALEYGFSGYYIGA